MEFFEHFWVFVVYFSCSLWILWKFLYLLVWFDWIILSFLQTTFNIFIKWSEEVVWEKPTYICVRISDITLNHWNIRIWILWITDLIEITTICKQKIRKFFESEIVVTCIWNFHKRNDFSINNIVEYYMKILSRGFYSNFLFPPILCSHWFYHFDY